MKRHDRYSEVEAFVLTAQTGGIGSAANRLGVAASVVSRKLQALEARLGTRLLERNTRQVRLTETGQVYLARMQRWLADLDDADQVLVDQQGKIEGVLRVTLPSNFARLHVLPMLPELLQRYPQLHLDLDFTDKTQDLLVGGFDVAVRIGRLPDSSLVARKLADNYRLLVASPAYLERAGWPQHPHDLRQHSCLHFAYFRDGDHWQFERDDERVEVPVSGRVRANYGEALYTAALAGFGILQSAAFIVGAAVKRGELIELLPEWRVPVTGIYAVYPQGRYLAPKVRAFIDFLVEKFERPSWMN